jgi:hypothetical protein
MYPQACRQIGRQVNGRKLETAYFCGFSFEPWWLIEHDGFFFQFFQTITVEDAPEVGSWASTSQGGIGMSDNKATEMQRNGSIYARGVCMVKMKPSAMERGRDLTGKVLDLLECLKEAGALNQTAAATAMRRNRQSAGRAAKSLWRSGMIDIYNVLSRDVNGFNAQFQLWVAGGCR